MSDDYTFDTLSLHAGHVPDDRYGSRAVPIHQTTSYVFKDTRHAAALYNMEVGGIYIRAFPTLLLRCWNSVLRHWKGQLPVPLPLRGWRRFHLRL